MFRSAYLLLVLTTLMWAGNAVVGKLAVGHVSPMALTFLRWTMAIAILLPFGWRRLAQDWPQARARLPVLAWLGASGFGFFACAFYMALNYTSAINVAIEQASIPVLILLVNFVLFRVRVSLAQGLGCALALFGVALTVSHGEPRRLAALEVNFGDAVMVLGLLSYAAFSVGLRFRPQIHWTSLTMVMSGFAVLVTLPFLAWEAAAGNLVWPDMRGWAIVAYTAVFASVLSQNFYIKSVELIGANRAGLFINLMPIFGTLLAILLLGESFRPYHALAIVLVLGGIWLAEYSGRKMARKP